MRFEVRHGRASEERRIRGLPKTEEDFHAPWSAVPPTLAAHAKAIKAIFSNWSLA